MLILKIRFRYTATIMIFFKLFTLDELVMI